jgi:uncharacterized YigZ family protein
MLVKAKITQTVSSRICVRYISTILQSKLTLIHNSTHSETIKKSVFVVHAGKANTFEEAKIFLSNVRDDSATHNCWAYNSGIIQRSSDDGEPAGTAGRPILQALLSENMMNVMVVVIRYYGGIKLGTGGLARAYGGTAQTTLRNAVKAEYIPTSTISIRTLHRDSHTVYSMLKPFRIIDVTQCCDGPEDDTANEGALRSGLDLLNTTLRVEVPSSEVEVLRGRFRDALQGRGDFETE